MARRDIEKDILREPFLLEGLAEYQDSAIVSRTVINKPAGTVTFFAFDKGQELSEHTAPFDALVVILDGEARISISGEWHKVERGEAIIMPSGKPHSVKAVERFKMLLVMIKS